MKKRLFEDTDEDAERVLIDLARATPAWRKIQQVNEITRMMRTFAMIGLRQRYPNATEEELRRRLAALVLPRDLVIKAYGWDPEVEGY
jgi:hypothetical protein